MLRFSSIGGIALVASLALLEAHRPSAHACGGCFGPVGQPSTVTAHRMALSISPAETTLWDQFQYAGDPEDFVWVLPVHDGPSVEIELADNTFFEMLSGATQVQLQGPPPPFSGGGSGFGCGGADAAGAAPGTDTRGVTVHREEVVGPYETVVVGAGDGATLVDWLQERGYAVPDSLVPVIMHYVEQDMSFVAVRLSPNSGINRMQPVRVTTPGMAPTLPLRMVAAGVADEVSLELFVIADGRWEAASFPNAEIDEEELVYDWDTGTFNYDDLAAAALEADAGRTWLTEYATAMPAVSTDAYAYGDADGYHSPAPDWAVAVRSLGGSQWVTRMRAALPAEALSEDLTLQASERGERPGFINVTRERNRPSGVPPLGAGRLDADGVPPAAALAGWFALVAALLFARRRVAAMRAG